MDLKLWLPGHAGISGHLAPTWRSSAALGVVIYLLGVHGALCSMDITEPDTGWKWESVAHVHAGPVFKLSAARPDGNEKKTGTASIACEVTAQVAKKNDPAGYVEIKGKTGGPLDLTQYRALSFSYRFSLTLPDKCVNTMWLYLGCGTKERIELMADGQWHEVVIPLYEFITNPRDAILEKTTGITFCYYVSPTEENQEVKFTFWLDDIKLEEKSQGKQRPAILCLTPSTKETYGRETVEFISEPVEKELKNRGFERGWHVGWDDLCMNYLKAFNAVIFFDYPFLTPGEAIPPEVQKKIELFQKYVKEGGSLFFASSPYTQAKIIVMNELMKPMNGKVYAELVKDESTAYKLSYPCPSLPFSWTDAITRSPLTEGVNGLYYGTTFWEPGSPTTLPAEVGNEWQILVRGLPSTGSFKVDPNASAVSGKGAFAESPPLVAVREYGKGRIVLWPMSLTFTMMDGCNWMLENGIVMDGKANGRISNGGRLLYNLLQWLVEPSMLEMNFGGYKIPDEISSSKKKKEHKSIKWHKPSGSINPLYQHAYLGLVGAMSQLSSGKSSPEEMIAAAKTAGYRFIVFTEDVETLSRDSWDKLIAVCKQNSGTNFYAFPGFYYKTQWGAEYITFGGHADLCYPLPEWVVEVDGKRRIKENNCFVRGLKETPPVVMVYPGRNPRPLRVNAQFYGFSTHTYEGGKLMDEAVNSYLKLQREGLLLFPMAVHFVKSTDEIKGARSEGLQSYIRANALEGVPRSVQGMAQSLNSLGWCKPAFASSGPEIQYLYAGNWGTTDLAIPGADRHRLQVKISSEVGLKEIIIYDNAELFRRFLPGGTKEFSGQIDNYHDKQHNYVVQATDINGGVAISWSRSTDMSECSFGMCGDNWNDMPTGKYGGSGGSGGGGGLRGTECRAPSSSSVWGWPCLPNYGPEGFACLKESGIVTRFGWIVDYSLDHMYERNGQASGIYDNIKVIPNPFFKGKIRSYLSTGRNPKPNFGMSEGAISFAQNTAMKGSPGLFTSYIFAEHNKGYFIYPDADGKKTIHDKGKKHETVEGMLMPDDYVAFFPPVTGLFNLGNKPLLWTIWNALPGRLILGLGRGKDTFKKDDTLNWRIFGVSGGKGSDQRFLDDIRVKMGLTGSPAYQVIPKTGKVVGTRLYLNLAAERHGFRGKITQADLPLVLTGFISGLNPRWSAGIWYKGENILKVIEYYHNVVDRVCTNEIIRIGVLDGTGYFQIDIEEKDRDVYIGNLVTADNPDLFLSLFQDEDGVYVIAHNPTDNEISAVIRPGPGFDLYGSFRKKVMIKPGSSLTVDLPAGRQGADRNKLFVILAVGVVLCMAILFFIVKKKRRNNV